MMPETSMNKDMQKRRDAMKARLSSLGKNNPVVKEALKMQEPPQEDTKWKNWRVVDELVSAARHEYFDKEGGSLGDCVGNLAEALSKLASKKGLDTENKKTENNSNKEDY